MSREQDKEVPLVLHPDSFLERRFNIPVIGHPLILPELDEGELKEARADIVKSEKAFPIANGLIHTTGEIERKIPFEKGFPGLRQRLTGTG
ncbi:7,8 dihydropteroate synthase (methanopterin) [Methanosarcina siciliae HI350]|uniref:7,8 dihydropteroate synthase (Methanopterin) n=1 Tax=Methanosarcina siciliae HI350 TaxID=1434119 RepID=A0A0E3PED7_9EURY|nr:7,8 dihydropteroate synthase (methanopterin) [Methanosarcina siciliae HI350]